MQCFPESMVVHIANLIGFAVDVFVVSLALACADGWVHKQEPAQHCEAHSIHQGIQEYQWSNLRVYSIDPCQLGAQVSHPGQEHGLSHMALPCV